jgi:hypothetical protein
MSLENEKDKGSYALSATRQGPNQANQTSLQGKKINANAGEPLIGKKDQQGLRRLSALSVTSTTRPPPYSYSQSRCRISLLKSSNIPPVGTLEFRMMERRQRAPIRRCRGMSLALVLNLAGR